MTVIVVGAGISGLACARELLDAGVPVRVVERGPVVGGRLASEWLDGRWVDTGAAYLTADDPAFEGRVQTWRIDGLLRPWTDTFRGQHGEAPMRWSAPLGLRSLAVDLARELEVTLNTEVTEPPGAASAVVLTMPAPEVPIKPDKSQLWYGVTTVILTYPERTWPSFHGMFVNDSPILTTVCDDGDRRGDQAPVLVAHAKVTINPDKVADEVGRLLGIDARPRVKTVEWPHAQPEKPLHRLFDRHSGNVYRCGDAYGEKSRIQTAWLSGRATARAIIGDQRTD